VELHLRRVGLHVVACARAGVEADLAPPVQRRAAAHVLRRVARDHLGGDLHQVAHAAVEIEPVLDVVLRDLADLAGGDVHQRRELLQPHRDGSRRRADASAIRHHQRQRHRELFELALQDCINDCHRETLRAATVQNPAAARAIAPSKPSC
jgi:hypothetical protein